RVGVLPIDTGESTLQIHTLILVEFHTESVVRKRGNCRADQNKNCHQNNGRLNSHRDGSFYDELGTYLDIIPIGNMLLGQANTPVALLVSSFADIIPICA